MAIELFAHPFSSYCQKALVALRENETEFSLRMLGPGSPAQEELARIWPLARFPVLREGDRVVPEATSIIEYLHVHHRGPVALIPDDADAAVHVRMLDRFFDNYISNAQASIVFNAIREPEDRDPVGDDKARATLDTAYRWLDSWMEGKQWAAGGAFSLADCAAAPALFYADWTHEIGKEFRHVQAYRSRLLDRPSFARAVDEARGYRHLFPLGAPDRD